MTLKIKTQEDEQRQLAVTIEVAEDRLQKAMRKTARKMAKQVRIPGFRPGKAPYSVVNGYFGDESIRQEALQEMLPSIYDEMLKEVAVDPYAQPTLDEVVHNPMVLKMTIPLEPSVVLGDYRAMRLEVEPVTVADEAIDESLETMRDQRAETEVVERAAALNDLVKIAGKGHIGDDENDVIFKDEGFETNLVEDGVFPGTTFAENIVGMSAGDDKTFSISFPEDFEEENLAGKEGHFELQMLEVKSRTLPELNDEFAQEVSREDDKTMEQLRAEVAENLQKQAESQHKNDLLEGAITEMLENVEELVYPPQVVEQQTTEMIAELRQRVEQAQVSWPDYLAAREYTEQNLRDEYEDAAVERVERGLIFQEYVKSEQIVLSDEDVEAAMEERLQEYDESFRDTMRQFLVGQGGAMIRQELLMDRVYDRTVAIYSGDAPDLSSSEGEEAEDGDGEAEVEAKPKKKKAAAKPKKKAAPKAKAKKEADPEPATENDES